MTTQMTTRWAKAALLGALFSTACSSSNSSDTGASGSGNVAGGTSTGGSSSGGAENSGAGVAGLGTSGAGGTAGKSGTGGAPGASSRGIISLDQGQVSSHFNYSASAPFTRFGASQSANATMCTVATIGACVTSVCMIPDTDGGLPTAQMGPGLDAGAITITGVGASKAALTFGVLPQSNQPGYLQESGMTQFFKGGDAIAVVGSGGADLPAFAAHTVVAPNDVVLTAPTCAGLVCADVDRTQDLAVTWTGGGAGSFSADFETVGSTTSVAVLCQFDAKSGAGTVPKAALALLGDTRDGETTGVEIFLASNEATFDVGDIPTTFSVLGSGTEALMTVSK